MNLHKTFDKATLTLKKSGKQECAQKINLLHKKIVKLKKLKQYLDY